MCKTVDLKKSIGCLDSRVGCLQMYSTCTINHKYEIDNNCKNDLIRNNLCLCLISPTARTLGDMISQFTVITEIMTSLYIRFVGKWRQKSILLFPCCAKRKGKHTRKREESNGCFKVTFNWVLINVKFFFFCVTISSFRIYTVVWDVGMGCHSWLHSHDARPTVPLLSPEIWSLFCGIIGFQTSPPSDKIIIVDVEMFIEWRQELLVLSGLAVVGNIAEEKAVTCLPSCFDSTCCSRFFCINEKTSLNLSKRRTRAGYTLEGAVLELISRTVRARVNVCASEARGQYSRSRKPSPVSRVVVVLLQIYIRSAGMTLCGMFCSL